MSITTILFLILIPLFAYSFPTSKPKVLLYTLCLEHGYFYVGTTQQNMEHRIRDHLSSNFSTKWTSLHRPIHLDYLIDCSEYSYPKLAEDYLVEQLMIQYGIDKVRGGSYSQEYLTSFQENFTFKVLTSS